MVKVRPQSPVAVVRRLGFNDPPTAGGCTQCKSDCSWVGGRSRKNWWRPAHLRFSQQVSAASEQI